MADSTLQEIKDRLNIADVMGTYITIKKAGANFKAVCPFHNEKTASLNISTQKQIWHCFGCGEGGDVISFVMKYENIEFKEALKILAAKAGVKLPEWKPQDPQVADEKDTLLRINSFAARLYHEILMTDKRGAGAMEYLKKRGLTEQTIIQWQIGYAPEEFHTLDHALQQKKVSLQDLVKAGVSSKNEKGQVYDRFRGRVTFPIFDYLGDIVGFTARILDGGNASNMAKYINSPETPIYNKSKILFGLNFAKNEIRKLDEVIIVEGQMDCIAAHQAGFKNVIASSGTALTEFQLITTLGRLTKNIKFCLDTDAAGIKATRRAIEMYLGKDIVIRIVTLGGAKDPDELIKKDPALFARQVHEAPLFLDYYIQKMFEGYSDQSVEQKKQIAKEILPLVKYLADPIERDHYIQLLAQKFGTLPKVLEEALRKEAEPVRATASLAEKKQAIAQIPHSTEPSIVEKQIIGGMLLYPQFQQQVTEHAHLDDFQSTAAKAMVGPLLQRKSSPIPANSVLAKEATFMVESQLTEYGNEERLLTALTQTFARLRLATIKRHLQALTEAIRTAEKRKETAQLNTLTKEFAALTRTRIFFEKQL